jgi:hypothetical protein
MYTCAAYLASPTDLRERMLDPISIITAVGAGLKLIDQFRDLAIKVSGRTPSPPSTLATKEGSAIEIKAGGQVLQRIESSQLKTGSLDDVRFRALEHRIASNWALYYGNYSELPMLAADERVRVQVRMERMKQELCQDFRSITKMYEDILGVGLPDHYSLYEVCTGP